jgi:gliding motility-associated-like protein
MKKIFIVLFQLNFLIAFAQGVVPASWVVTINGDTILPFDTVCLGTIINIYGVENQNIVNNWEYTITNAEPNKAYTKDVVSVSLPIIGICTLECKTNIGQTYSFIVVKHCPPKANFILPNNPTCQYECMLPVDSSSNYPETWEWYATGANNYFSNSEIPNNICFADTGNQTITLVVSNSAGNDTATKSVYVYPAPIPENVQQQFTIEYGDSIYLEACANGANYIWKNGNATICSNCNDAIFFVPQEPKTNITAIVSNNGLCDKTCNYTIITKGIPEQIVLPTAFSPNSDRSNDGFGILNNARYRKVNSFKIFNRWGQEVFSARSENDRWDGTFKGEPADSDVYIWVIALTNTLTNKSSVLKGNVTLVR